VKPLLRRAGAVAGYTVFLLAVLEVACRLLLSSDRVVGLLPREDPTARRGAWVHRHGKAADLTYTFDTYDSVRGWAIAPSLEHVAVFDGSVLNSTARGVRGTADIPYERVSGKHRILVLGDSYTFGEGVSDDETYASALGRLLANTEVVNLGVHGYGHDQMLEYLRTEGVKYHPDVVILGYVWFDQYRNLDDFTSYSKPVFVLHGGRLMLGNVPVPAPKRVISRNPWRSATWDVGAMLVNAARWRLGMNESRAHALTTAILDEIVRTAREQHAVPLLVYLPVLTELGDTSGALSVHEQFLRSYCDASRAACLFLRPAFLRSQFDARSHGHWSAAEHLVAARAIAVYLAEHHLADTVATRTAAP
jgi:hypothetical protein